MPYSTKQQQAVLAAWSSGGRNCSPPRIWRRICGGGLPVGLATVYRQLEKLEQAGRVHKVNTEEGAFYQFCSHDANGHRDCFFAQCEACGCIRHLDCSHLQILYDHLEQDHHFRINPPPDIVFGVVRRMRRKGRGGTWKPPMNCWSAGTCLWATRGKASWNTWT